MTKKVLIIEDNLLIAEDMADAIRHHLDANPVVAESCQEAEDLIGHDVALALLDLNVKDGPTHSIARQLGGRSVPFFFVSASSPESIPDDLKCVPFVQKPFRVQTLVTVAKSLNSVFGSAPA